MRKRHRRYGDDEALAIPAPQEPPAPRAASGDGEWPTWIWVAGLAGLGGLAYWWWQSQQAQAQPQLLQSPTAPSAPTVPQVTLTSTVTKAPIPVAYHGPAINPALKVKAGALIGGSSGGSASVASNAQPSQTTQSLLSQVEAAEAAFPATANGADVTPSAVTPMVAPVGPSPNTELQRDLLTFGDGSQASVCSFATVPASSAAWQAWNALGTSMSSTVGAPLLLGGGTVPAVVLLHGPSGSAAWAFCQYAMSLGAGKG